MKIITKQEYYNSVPDEWYEKIGFCIPDEVLNTSDDLLCQYDLDKKTIWLQLYRLKSPITKKQLFNIFGEYTDWVDFVCGSCQKEVEKVVELDLFLDETKGFLCETCLKKALVLIQEKISKYFSRIEFECHCGCKESQVDRQLINVLEDIRYHFDSPIIITSGFRCEMYNKEIGGSFTSKHMLGLATDIQMKTILPIQIYKYLDDKYPNTYGIGLYNTWVHIDVRREKTRWDMRK